MCNFTSFSAVLDAKKAIMKVDRWWESAALMEALNLLEIEAEYFQQQLQYKQHEVDWLRRLFKK